MRWPLLTPASLAASGGAGRQGSLQSDQRVDRAFPASRSSITAPGGTTCGPESEFAKRLRPMAVDESHARTAFTAALCLDRRQQPLLPGQQQPPAITAVALDSGCQRLYVGLEDGVIEEHALLRSHTGVRTSLAARQHAAKKAILEIHALPEAGLVVVLGEDGLVLLLDAETLEGRPLPLRHAVATCVATPPGRLPQLAVACKPSKRSTRFLIYELPPGSGGTLAAGQPHPPTLLAQAEVPDGASAVHGMGWVGPHLAVCCGMRYLLVAPLGPALTGGSGAGGGGGRWRELFAVPEELAYWPAMLATMPDLARALLLVGPAGVVVDAAGNPVGSSLLLEGLGATPRALCASGAFLLVVSEAGIHVFDRQGGGEVQRLAFAPELRPLPGQPLYAASAPAADGGGGGGQGSAANGGGRAVGGAGAGCVAVAGRRVVWLCSPVSAADQARELLGQGDFEAALELINAGLARGEAWAQAGAAQAALLLLHECRFEEAVRCLEQVGPDTFQPAQLFPLFSTYTAPWASQVPAHQRYWGLHAPLPSLESLISAKLLRGQRQQESGGSGSAGRGSRARGSTSSARGGGHGGSSRASSSLFGLEGSPSSAGGAGGDGEASSAASSPSVGRRGSRPAQQQAAAGALDAPSGNQREGTVTAAEGAQRGQDGSSSEPAAAAQHEQESRRQPEQAPERRQLQRRAWEALAQYLFRVRMLGGVSCLPGVDTLLLLLLADLGDARQVAAFSSVPNEVEVAAVEPRLQAERWHHALAALHAARGEAELALSTWRQVADGALASPAAPAVQAAERREALQSAAALLRDPRACPEATLVSYIPWLLAASQPAALEALTARRLTPAAVLPLLPPDSDVRWQYLAHLVEAEEEGGFRPGPGLEEGLRRQQGPGQAAALQPASPAAAGLAAAAADAAVHTELAIQLAAAILRSEPALRSPEAAAGAPPPPRRPPLSRRPSSGGSAAGDAGGVAAAGGRRRSSRPSTAALVSGGSLEPWPGMPAVEGMRLRLRAHLQRSKHYDEQAVLASLQGTGLHEELVVLHSKLGDHMAALRLLALTLHDVAAAEAYARAHLAPADYRSLLHMVLDPGPGLEPRWEDACYLITALGDHLDPQEVLQALPPTMPLASAADVLAPMLRDRLHRRRQGSLVKNLHRARLAVAAGARCDAESQHVTVGEDRACPSCHLRIGGKVFVVLQPGGEAAAGPSPAGQQQQQQQQQQQGEPAGGAAAAAEEEGSGLRPPGDDWLTSAARRLQQQAEAGQEPRVLCYACYQRLSGAGGAGSGAAAAAAGAAAGGQAAGPSPREAAAPPSSGSRFDALPP